VKQLEVIMKKREKLKEDVIDLGIASVETKGGQDQILDSALSLQKHVGISDD